MQRNFEGVGRQIPVRNSGLELFRTAEPSEDPVRSGFHKRKISEAAPIFSSLLYSSVITGRQARFMVFEVCRWSVKYAVVLAVCSKRRAIIARRSSSSSGGLLILSCPQPGTRSFRPRPPQRSDQEEQ